MAYQHGIRVVEEETALASPIENNVGVQVIFGTAPINLARNPEEVVNKPVLCKSFAECVEKLGYSDDYESYTLCQSMDMNFRVFAVSLIVMVNVLDPKKHFKTNDVKQVAVTAKQALVAETGIIRESVVIKNGDTALAEKTDYLLSFNTSGQLLITMIAGGAGETLNQVTVESNSIDPAAVKKEDIIGGYDAVSGNETGIETVRQVYPKFNLTPGMLLAPGWSQMPEVGAVLAAKCERINGVFRAECLVDLNTETAKRYTDCKKVKTDSGFENPHQVVLWPMLKIGEKIYAYSAVFAAMTSYVDAENGNVPNISPSNRLLNVAGTVLKDGTEVVLDQEQANTINGEGIITAVHDGGWRSWGNNTACYPGNKDPKDRWLCCRRVFTWWGNSFIRIYREKIDNPADQRLIEAICDSENIRGNSYVSQGKLAGARMEFRKEDNEIGDILEGRITFRQHIAPYTPAEDITNILSFDISTLESALGGN